MLEKVLSNEWEESPEERAGGPYGLSRSSLQDY